MESLDVKARVKQILTKRVGIPPEQIELGAELVADLGLDSVDLVELAIAAEREFNIEISDEQMKGLLTVADVVDLMKRLVDEQGGSYLKNSAS